MDMPFQLKSLVAAIDAGSLSGAARVLGVTQPAVSQKLTALEAAFGQPLLIRSRNGVQPTPAGRIAYQYGVKVLSELTEMTAALDALKGEVSGNLRVTTNMLLSQTVMGPVIAELRQQYPALRIELIASDEILDVDSEGIDLALRFGSSGTGSGITRRIGELEGAIVATPAYLNAAGRPEAPEQLDRLSYIQYREDPEEREIALVHAGGRVVAPVSPAFSAQHPSLVLHAVETGLGFAKAPLFYIGGRLRRGEFEEVLPGYAPAPKPIYFIQSEHARNTLRARIFREKVIGSLARVEGIRIAADLLNGLQE